MSSPKSESKTFESTIYREFWENCGYTVNPDGTPSVTELYIRLFDYNQTDIKGFIQFIDEYHPELASKMCTLLAEYITTISIHNSSELFNQINDGVLL